MSDASSGSVAPRDREADLATLRNILALAQGAQVPRAIELAQPALESGLEHPLLFNLVALGHENAGRLDEAVEVLQRGVTHSPRDVSLRNALGLCLNRLDRWAEALEHFDALLAIDPAFAPAHANRATSLEGLGELNAAESSYRRTLELSPGHLTALVGIATILGRRGDHADARTHAEEILTREPNYPQGVQVAAAADIALGAPVAAETRLRALLQDARLSPLERGMTEGHLGDALDAQGRYADAFAAYAAGNEGRRSVYSPRFAGGEGPLQVLAWMREYLESSQGRAAAARRIGTGTATLAAGTRGHVFLLGFPRSGTTLLEQALGQAPEVATLDEKETLIDGVREFLRSPADLARLYAANERELDAFRDRYWQRVSDHGADVRDRVLVDKHPLNTLKLPLIVRLFPQARILFARRDPRDVVLSCFRRRFAMSAPMFELLRLDGAARLYAAAMQLATAVEANSAPAVHVVRHEALVADFDTEMRRICAFAGVTWSPTLVDFALRVKANASATPSAAQLARGLSADGIGYWRHYAAALESVMPVLSPWIERFGYELVS